MDQQSASCPRGRGLPQQPASSPSGRGRGFLQFRQQMEETQQPQQPASGPSDRRYEFFQSSQQTEGIQLPQQLASGPRGMGRGFLQSRQQMEETQQLQQLASGPRGRGRGFLLSRQQMEETQQSQQLVSGPRGRGRGFVQSKQQTEGTQQLRKPASDPRSWGLEFFQSSQQTEGIQQPQQPASGPRGRGRGFLLSRQQTEETQQSQLVSGPRGRGRGFLLSRQQMEETQQSQQLVSGPRGRGRGFLLSRQQMEETQQSQQLVSGPRGRGRGFLQSEQQTEGIQQPQHSQQMPVPRHVQARLQGIITSRPTDEEHKPQVEQVTTMMGSMNITGKTSIGRGAVRGRRILNTVQYNGIPRPVSSNDGKQGMTGQPIQVTANYFPITSDKNWSLYQYTINFNPKEHRIPVKRRLLSEHKEFLGSYIFDGESMFSSTKYNLNNFELTSTRASDYQIIIMSITFVNTIKTHDYANIQVFNLLLNNCCKHLELKPVERNYYDTQAKTYLSTHKLELWPGYETSIGLLDNGLLLRIEISTKIMRQETVLDFLKECIADSDPSDPSDFMMKFRTGVIGKIVITPYNDKSYRIDDVNDSADINSSFEMKDGTVMCFKNYYAERWNCKSIFDGRQPLLVSIKKKFSINGDNDKEELVHLVPEFCNLTGLTDAMRNNCRLMKDLAVHTRVDPEERINRYYKFSRHLQSKPICLETFNNWNLTLGNELIKIPARVLPIEQLSSNNSQYDGGSKAYWLQNVRSLPMFTSAVMKRWLILTPNVHIINAFVSNLQKAGRAMSFSLPQPEIVEIKSLSARDYVVCLEKVINERNPSFILCVITTQRNDIYSVIKRKLCVDRAVPSQVVLMENVKENHMTVCRKIVIQINCKLGGAPWTVNIPVKRLMVMGFDVCQDSCNKSVSYGALIASLNDTHTSYFSRVERHKDDKELSTHFSISIAKALDKYRSKNGVLPKSIVIYRDGVEDEQLLYINGVEVENIKKTFMEFYEQEPPFAFIIVQKNTSTRFFTINSRNAIPENPQPGTVIDQVVTKPSMYDFFLVSQNARHGTVTPTHYNIIEDTLVDWSPDKMQRLTYKLTHMYYNWPGTIRVPAHCQLAHKLAFLTAQSLKTSPNIELNELLYFL